MRINKQRNLLGAVAELDASADQIGKELARIERKIEALRADHINLEAQQRRIERARQLLMKGKDDE